MFWYMEVVGCCGMAFLCSRVRKNLKDVVGADSNVKENQTTFCFCRFSLGKMCFFLNTRMPRDHVAMMMTRLNC